MTERLLKISEVSARTGIAAGTLYNWAHTRRIPTVKLGAALRIRESTLDAIIRRAERPALR